MYHFTDDEGKQVLIECGVLPKHAVNWKRKRAYGQLADRWCIHERQIIAERRNNYLREVARQYEQENNSVSFHMMPYDFKKRYGELMSRQSMWTDEDWRENMELSRQLMERIAVKPVARIRRKLYK